MSRTFFSYSAIKEQSFHGDSIQMIKYKIFFRGYSEPTARARQYECVQAERQTTLIQEQDRECFRLWQSTRLHLRPKSD